MKYVDYVAKISTYYRRINEAKSPEEIAFLSRELDLFTTRCHPEKPEMLNTVHHFQAGDRVMSKATRVLGYVDRVLPTKYSQLGGNLVIITDSGQTVCD